MADALPDNMDASEEPKHLSDSENESLSLKEAEDEEAGRGIRIDELNPDDDAESHGGANSDGEEDEVVDSDSAPRSPAQGFHDDTEQGSETGLQDIGHEDTENPDDQNNVSMESGLLDEEQPEVKDDEETSENAYESESYVGYEEEGEIEGGQKRSGQGGSTHPEGSLSPECASDEGPPGPDQAFEEGPLSPDYASNEGPLSPDLDEGELSSAMSDSSEVVGHEQDNNDIYIDTNSDALDNQGTEEGLESDLTQNKSMQGSVSPGPDQDMTSPDARLEQSTAEQTGDDSVSSVCVKESESVDMVEVDKHSESGEISEEDVLPADNVEGPASPDEGGHYDVNSADSNFSDHELENDLGHSNTENKSKYQIENISDDINSEKSKTKEETAAKQKTTKENKSEKYSRSDAGSASQKVTTSPTSSDTVSHRRSVCAVTNLDSERNMTTATKAGLHDDHGELDYYEDVDDVHMDVQKKVDGDADQSGEGGKELEDGAIDSEGEEGEIEDGEDEIGDEEGELNDEDCEEGEIKEPDGRKPFVPPVCRFYNRGHCTWGLNCRFLHPGVNDKGNYSLIDPPGQMPGGKGNLRSRLGGPWRRQERESELLPPPIEEPVVESAWERGLRQAKELMKKANKRKESDTNFEEKKMNLPLEEDQEQNKENDYRQYPKDPYYDQEGYDQEELLEGSGGKPLQSWQQGHYENLEIRWTSDRVNIPPSHVVPPNVYRNRERGPGRGRDVRDMRGTRDNNHQRSAERYERKEHRHHQQQHRHHRSHDQPRKLPPSPLKSSIKEPEERAEKILNKPRVHSDEWRDPWMRAKSPKIRKGSRSRSRSRGRRRKRLYSRGSKSSSSSSSRSSRSRSSSYSSYSSRSSYSRSSSFSSRSRSRSASPRPSGAAKKPVGPKKGAGLAGQKKVPPKPGDPPISTLSTKGQTKSPVKKKTAAPVNSDKGPVGPGRGIPKTMSAAGAERGRKMEKTAGMHRRRKKASSASSSGSSVSRSRSRSSSRSRSGSANSRSSGSSSWSSSSSGSADSANLYRDIAGPVSNSKQTISPKKNPSKSGTPAAAPADKTSKEKLRKEDPKRPPTKQQNQEKPAERNDDKEKMKEKQAPKTPQKTLQKTPTKQPGAPTRQTNVPSAQLRDPPPPQSTNQAPAAKPPPVGPVRSVPPQSDNKSDSSRMPKNQIDKTVPPADSRAKSTVTSSKGKDPLKLSGQKPSIKLTLLKKPQEKTNQNSQSGAPSKKRAAEVSSSPPPAKRPAKTVSPPKAAIEKERKEHKGVKLTLNKPDKAPARPAAQSVKNKPEVKTAKASGPAAVKKPESPQKAVEKPAATVPVVKPKKSTSSRREELLKQLKAVEDAIARKRSKIN